MKQRTFLWTLLSFLLGMAVAYGLVILDRKASVPRLASTDIFEVVAPDGNILRLSYEEIERERRELRDLRQRSRKVPKAVTPQRGWKEARRLPTPQPPEANAVPRRASAERPADQALKGLFAKIFSQPIMQDLMQAQITRRTGELADVLDLTEEQRASVEKALRKRKPTVSVGGSGPSSGPAPEEEQEPETTLEDDLQTILTPEQYQRYQEYTGKKRALAGAPGLDRQIFELEWRLGLTEEQEAPVRQALNEEAEQLELLSSSPALGSNPSPADRLEERLARRTAVNRETAEKMKTVLDEDQYEAFLRYQAERDTETRLLKHLIREERAGATPATP